MSNKVNIELEILNLMHVYATVKDFLQITETDKSDINSDFNYALLKRAFSELEKEISRVYTEEYGDICADTYENLEKEFNEKT